MAKRGAAERLNPCLCDLNLVPLWINMLRDIPGGAKAWRKAQVEKLKPDALEGGLPRKSRHRGKIDHESRR